MLASSRARIGDVERLDGRSTSETQEYVMTNNPEIPRKRSGNSKPDALISMDRRAVGGREKKKGRQSTRDRDQPVGRDIRESPRASTIPPYPKQRIDD
jgi:hypothetical protein